MYPNKVIVAPAFRSALEAKSYISNMDIFMGARMHSTIGAISSGVVTIPFSYCHKFESLYSKINYPYIISATKISTEMALEKVKQWISNPNVLKKEGDIAVEKARNELLSFKEDLKNTIKKKGLL